MSILNVRLEYRCWHDDGNEPCVVAEQWEMPVKARPELCDETVIAEAIRKYADELRCKADGAMALRLSRRLLILERCRDCPHYDGTGAQDYCDAPDGGRLVEGPYIPDWCPLPVMDDKPEEGAK
jgi:hypothetical protein